MHALSQPTPPREFRFRRTLRISIFYTLAVMLTLTIPSNNAYLAAIVIFTFMAYYKWNPSFTNQWITATAIICPLYLLITPLLIQWPFVFLSTSLGLFVFFIYCFYSGQYIIFNVVAAATRTLITITGIINPNAAFDFIWIWLFGSALGFIVIKVSNITIYPQLARRHLEASILIELRTSMMILTNTLADLLREKHQSTPDNLQTPEKFMNLYALLSAGEFENNIVKKNLDEYRKLID